MTKVSGCLSVYQLRSPGYTDKSKGIKKKVCLRKSKILVNLYSKIWKGCGYEITDKRNWSFKKSIKTMDLLLLGSCSRLSCTLIKWNL